MKSHEPESEPTRRNFFARASIALGALLGAVLAFPTLGALIDPLRKRGTGGESPFLTAGSASGFPVGTPQKITLTGSIRDAWAQLTNQSIGAVWVIRRKETLTAESFDVFSTICPHLGCANHHENEGKAFHCPCHGSHFGEDGARTETGEARREPPDGALELHRRHGLGLAGRRKNPFFRVA